MSHLDVKVVECRTTLCPALLSLQAPAVKFSQVHILAFHVIGILLISVRLLYIPLLNKSHYKHISLQMRKNSCII